MPGVKFPILEVEKLRIAEDGAGIDFVNDGTVFLKSSVWSGPYYQSGSIYGGNLGSKLPKVLCAASSSGWIRITVRSGSAADTSYYIPFFSAADTSASV